MPGSVDSEGIAPLDGTDEKHQKLTVLVGHSTWFLINFFQFKNFSCIFLKLQKIEDCILASYFKLIQKRVKNVSLDIHYISLSTK